MQNGFNEQFLYQVLFSEMCSINIEKYCVDVECILVSMMNVPRCRISLILFNIHGDELLLATSYIRRVCTIYDV